MALCHILLMTMKVALIGFLELKKYSVTKTTIFSRISTTFYIKIRK